jgi:hypothetical protein
MRDTAIGAVSLERLTEDDNGDLVYMFTRPWSDGTTGIRLSPLALSEKLAAIVPLAGTFLKDTRRPVLRKKRSANRHRRPNV